MGHFLGPFPGAGMLPSLVDPSGPQWMSSHPCPPSWNCFAIGSSGQEGSQGLGEDGERGATGRGKGGDQGDVFVCGAAVDVS